MEQLVRGYGWIVLVLASLMIIFIVIPRVARRKASPRLPGGFAAPGLALELARRPGDVEDILNSTVTGEMSAEDRNQARDAMRETLRKAQIGDFFFITVYTTLLLGLSALLIRQAAIGELPLLVIWLGIAAAFCAIATALFDVVENIHILQVLNPSIQPLMPYMVNNVLDAAVRKWALFYLTFGLLSSFFLLRGGWARGVGGLFLLTALIGLFGIRAPRAFELAAIPMLLSLLAAGIFFAFSSCDFLRQS